MVITWYGAGCFKIQSGDFTIVTDPFSKESGLTPPRFKANIVTLSHGHSHVQGESIPENPIVIDGPGEYESGGVMVSGVETYHDAESGALRGLNTAYIIECEDIKLCHLGHFGEEKARGEVLEALGTVDILFVPVGGSDVIGPAMAKKMIQEIEPRIVIPMYYKTPGMKGGELPVDMFLKEMGIKTKTEEDRLTIKKKDLPQAEETKVVLLKTA